MRYDNERKENGFPRMSKIDVYQERYVRHQAKKAEVLKKIMEERHSNRIFADKEIDADTLTDLMSVRELCPSSCDRQGIKMHAYSERDDKSLLGGLLVGGVGWVHRAPMVILLFGDRNAYKAPGEDTFMPYIDAGVLVANLYLKATAMGLHCAYINPNIREANVEFFKNRFSHHTDDIFCGAFAVGYPKEN